MSDHRIIFGDALEALRGLEAESVDCCVTSPPYWGLRDYDTGTWEGGDPDCEHVMSPGAATGNKGHVTTVPYRDVCGDCGAWRIDKQLGLEATPEEYVASLVAIFAEVRRVLKPAGTVALVLGDSYASGKGTCHNPGGGEESLGQARKAAGVHPLDRGSVTSLREQGLKPKDLCLIPARVALALQADGWWIRNDVIWQKRNPMPESVTDRFSSTHEHVFLLAKAARYFFDLDAVRAEHTSTHVPGNKSRDSGGLDHKGRPTDEAARHPLGKNPGDVLTLATQPTPYAHFATFPLDLALHFIRALCPPQVCEECGVAYEHRVSIEEGEPAEDYTGQALHDYAAAGAQDPSESKRRILRSMARQTRDLGYHPACGCGTEYSIPQEELDADPTLIDDFEIEPPPPVPGTVLDPFAGSGTTTEAARKLGVSSIGIELNPEYEAVMRERFGTLHSLEGSITFESEGTDDDD